MIRIWCAALGTINVVPNKVSLGMAAFGGWRTVTGAENIQGFKRLWQGLLVQLVCQLVPVFGIGATILLAASGAEEEIAVGVGSAISVAALVVQMAAWVEIMAMLAKLKEASERFTRASRWYLASFLLLLAYLVSVSASGTLQEIGAQTLPFQGMVESVVTTLKFVLPLVAAWTLVDGYADYLDSIGETEARLKSFRRLKVALVVIALLQVALTIPVAVTSNLMPDSIAYQVFALLVSLTYPAGFCAQVVVVIKARSVWKTAEEVLS